MLYTNMDNYTASCSKKNILLYLLVLPNPKSGRNLKRKPNQSSGLKRLKTLDLLESSLSEVGLPKRFTAFPNAAPF